MNSKEQKVEPSTDTQMGYDTVLANRKASDREALKHKYFNKTELYWVRKRDGYRFDNEECGLAIDYYIETGQEP